MARKLLTIVGKACEVAFEVVLTVVLTPILPSLLSVAWAMFLHNSAQYANAIRDYPHQMALAVVISFALGLYLGFTIRLLRDYLTNELARRHAEEMHVESARQTARQLPYDSKVFLVLLAVADHMDVQKNRAKLQHLLAIRPEVIAVSEISYGVLRVTLTDEGRRFVEATSDILREARLDNHEMWWE